MVMNQMLSFLILCGVLFLGYVTWDKSRVKDPALREQARIEKAEKCAEFEQVLDDDGKIHFLDYSGRVRQVVNGCF